MKPTKGIVGLRIISISDGTQVGVVKDLVLNPQEKTLDFMIVDQPTGYLGAKIIAFKDILGLGEFAITIPHSGVIQDVAQNTEAQNLLKQDIRVLGTKVLTKKGQLIGETTEILIDEETGRIAACLFESGGQILEMGAEQIITLGKELLIVEGVQTASNHRVEEPGCEEPIKVPNITNLIPEADSAGESDLLES
ncbi:PRC-barrel domain protein (fragment) [Candidatus Desulfosporosinus infrequens]|uniref:PRC-barrel domain protein n=1 Tax=Candidatus Desulfosporosinus infrequens TaxID=2043169 RepID=A0A2U3LXZ3_9FIRM